MNAKKSLDTINLILGVLLLISPWVLGFSAVAAATWTAVILGVVIAADSIWALVQQRDKAPEWVDLVLGVLAFISPWALGFSGVAAAAWTAWILGLVIVVLTAVNLFQINKAGSVA